MARPRSGTAGGAALGVRFAGLAFALVLAAPAAAAEDGLTAARDLLQTAPAAVCPNGLLNTESLSLTGFSLVGVTDRGPAGNWVQRQLRLENPPAGLALEVSAVRAGEVLRRVTFQVNRLAGDRPVMVLLAGSRRRPQHARALSYSQDGRVQELILYAPDLETVEAVEALNPPVPDGTDPGGVTVAQIDSGVNYLLPEISARLARDGDGAFLGRDLWDGDARPFDGDFARSPFFPIRHGTPVASLLLQEAPEIRLLPLRYPRPDMNRMAEAVAIAAAAGARIVALPMGSSEPADWTAFAAAATDHPELLFIVSAGNDGRDIDAAPLYPASLGLDNMVVVTSADAFGRLAQGSNWGAQSVDLMVPAEGVEVIDYRGARGTASGSSYAVPRVAALAARLLGQHPDWATEDLKRALFARAAPPMERGAPKVAAGWIPNPADDL
jgi:hypothetical protein